MGGSWGCLDCMLDQPQFSLSFVMKRERERARLTHSLHHIHPYSSIHTHPSILIHPYSSDIVEGNSIPPFPSPSSSSLSLSLCVYIVLCWVFAISPSSPRSLSYFTSLLHFMADPTPSSQLPTEDTLASVHRALALLHQLQCSVSGFQLPSQLVLLERLNGLVSEFGNMHSASQDCHIQIPLEVLNFIDEGRNPDEYTKHLLNGCIQQNQASKGKVDSFKALRKHLLEQVEEVFPAETEAYRDIRNQSSLESRRSLHTGNPMSNGDMKLKIEH